MKLVENWRNMFGRMARWVAPFVYLGCLLVPVRNRPIDLLMLASLLASWLGWIVWARRKPVLCIALIVVGLFFMGLFCLPARQHTDANMAASYAQALQRYRGTTYWWGGETFLGIDCSGLIRAGMMDACLQEGFRTWDGVMFRHALDLWWHDESAQGLGDGYRGLTVPIGSAHSLNSLDYSSMKVGDLAVAGDGVHILAYLGDQRWIQADPEAGKVIIETVPSKNTWMRGPVKLVRWSFLAVPGKS